MTATAFDSGARGSPEHAAKGGMETVIMQHLLSTELALLENELARRSEPSGPAVHLLQRHTEAARVQSEADCKHLEATVQAAQREHAAADAAVSTALQLAQQELREQQELLSASREELLRSQEAARGTLLPPTAPGTVGHDGGSPSAGSTAWSVEERVDPQALAAVARSLCEALEPEAEEPEAAVAPAAAAAAADGCPPEGGTPPAAAAAATEQQAPGGAPGGGAPSGDGPAPLWSGLETATPMETAQALSEVLAWRSLQMQIGHVADAVSCLQCVPLGSSVPMGSGPVSGPAAAGCDAAWHAQPAGASARPGFATPSTGGVSAGPDVVSRLRHLQCGAPRPHVATARTRVATARPIARAAGRPPTHTHTHLPTHPPRVVAAAERSLSTPSALPPRKGARGKLGAFDSPEPARRGRHPGGSRSTLADRSRATANAMPAPNGGPAERVGGGMAMPKGKAHLVFRPTAAGLRLASEAERTPAGDEPGSGPLISPVSDDLYRARNSAEVRTAHAGT